MSRRAIRKTDIGTIILHWTLVVLLFVAVTTGLRIAIDSPHDMTWLQIFDFVLPQDIVWTAHIPVGTALFALAIAYTIYLGKTGLSRRIRPDLTRLTGLTRSRQARYGAINILLYWALFVVLVTQMVTGTMLYLGYGGAAADLHFYATWLIIGYFPCHIAVHYAQGGYSQLLRVFNPGRLAPPPAPFDPFDLIVAAPDGKAPPPRPVSAPGRAIANAPDASRRDGEAAPRRGSRSRTRNGQVLHAHPFVVAIAGGVGSLAFLLSLDTATRDTLTVAVVPEDQIPSVDGDVSDAVWRIAKPVRIPTQQGANLDSEGQSFVEIKAVHDGSNIYFSFIWNDPTRSLKHLPLLKTADGWRLLQDGFDREDANSYFEDKFAVLFTTQYDLIPGDRTFHAGRKPLADKPASLSGRGLHYTTDGGYADVWQWRAANGGMLGWIDDAHFGPPAEPAQAQEQAMAPYKGGFAADPGVDLTSLNFEPRGPGGYSAPISPKRLPKDWRRVSSALGKVDLNPDHGDGEGTVWWLSEADSTPYSAELDARIPAGTIVPGVLVEGSYTGDRADIRGAAKWAAGHWSLEAVRRLDTGSEYDALLATGTYMRVSVFDHTQSRHTRHIRPIRLEVNKCGKAAECTSTIKRSPPIAGKYF